MSDNVVGYVVGAAEIAVGIFTANYGLIAAGVGTALAATASDIAAKKYEDQARYNRDIIVRSATSPEMIVYGEAWIGGTMVYANQRPQPSSKDNYEIYMAIAHTGGNRPIVDINAYYFDNDYIAPTDINWGTGHITSGRYFVTKGGTYAVNLEKHLGTTTQTVSPLLNGAFAPDCTSAFRLRGRSYSVFQFNYFSATSIAPGSLFFSGLPSNIRARVRGCSVYDPRLDSTQPGGSGSHRTNSPGSWAFSSNPILCWTDYMTQFMHIPFTKIDIPWVIAQSNICEALVSIPPASSPTTRQPRYTCNGVISLGSTNRDNRDAILGPLGSCPKVSGLWRPTVGAYITPDVTLSEADYIGDMKVVTSASKPDRYNRVRGTYFSASDFAQQIDMIDVASFAYQARDNGEPLEKVIDLPMVDNEYEAQRIAWKLLLQSDQQVIVEIQLRWTGLRLAPGVGVFINHAGFNWTNKPFRCIQWKQGDSAESPITAVLREDESGAWSDPTIAEYSTRNDQGVITLGSSTIEPLAVTSFGVQTEPGANILEWNLPGDQETVDYYRLYAATSNSFGAATVIWEGKASSFMHFGSVGVTYWYWIVGVRAALEGIRQPVGSTSTVTATILPQATRGAPGQFPYVEDFSDNSYARIQSEWTHIQQAVPESILSETSTPPPMGGQYVLESGNNSGTDDDGFEYLNKDLSLPVEDGKLYRMIVVFRRKAGSDNSYFGVLGLAADKVTAVGCASNGGNHFYFVATSYSPPGTSWLTRIGYIRTSTGTGDDKSGTTTPKIPALLASTVKFISPIKAVNNNVGTGTYQVGYIALQEVNGDGEVSTVQLDPNAATQTFEVFDAGPDTYTDATAPTPYESLTVTGGMDADSVLIAQLTTTASASLSGGAIADVLIHVTWSGGGSYSESVLPVSAKQNFAIRRSFDTIPAATTFTVDVEIAVGAAGGSTITMENTALLIEVIKR